MVFLWKLRTEKLCFRGNDSTTAKQWKHEKTCGRPLGLRFDKESGDLYIADAYYGLLVVGPNGGLATPLATHVEGKPILFANDLDIHKNGSIFFTDTSKRYNRVSATVHCHFVICYNFLFFINVPINLSPDVTCLQCTLFYPIGRRSNW